MHYFVGMDVGGTNARLKLANEKGEMLGEYTGSGCTISTTSFDHVSEVFRKLIETALMEHHLTPQDCEGLCIGASGVDTEDLREQYTRIFEQIGFRRPILKVYNDCELLVQIYPNDSCLVVVAGTGSIVIGKDVQNHMARYGGWSHILGDEGSAFYIVKKAMEAILRYMDGYGDCRILTELFKQTTGLFTPYDISAFVNANIMKKSLIACYAPVVDKAAEQGDATAITILREAALTLFWGASTVADAIGSDCCPFKVVLWGSVLLHSKCVAEELKRLLLQQYPQADIIYPEDSALDSVLNIAVKSFQI